jgi:hypothetical protein
MLGYKRCARQVGKSRIDFRDVLLTLHTFRGTGGPLLAVTRNAGR